MKDYKPTKIARELGLSHSAVSQWFNGDTIPKYKYMLLLNTKYEIPFTAWQDIKSFIASNNTSNETDNAIPQKG